MQLIIFLCVCVCVCRSQDLIASEYCSSKARAHSIHGYCHTTEWPASFEWFHHEGRIIEPSRNNPLTDQETDKKNNRVTEQPTTANHLTRQSFGQLVSQKKSINPFISLSLTLLVFKPTRQSLSVSITLSTCLFMRGCVSFPFL